MFSKIVVLICSILLGMYFPLFFLLDFNINIPIQKHHKNTTKLSIIDKNKNKSYKEPYEESNFPKWKDDIDINDFWESWTQNSGHEYRN